jgi:hypothetical protein
VSVTDTLAIGPPCAVTFTVVFGATDTAPLAGAIRRLVAPLEDEEDEELDELDPVPDGPWPLVSFWQPLTTTSAVAAAAATQPARAKRVEGVIRTKYSFGASAGYWPLLPKTRDNLVRLRAYG